MCNPGGAAALLGLRDDMELLHPGVKMKEFEAQVGHELGVVRISLGLASNFHDVYRVLKFAGALADTPRRETMWGAWREARASAGAAAATAH